jgi:cytochrome b561
MSHGDNSTRYGTISRLLHWRMALLLLIQFASALVHLLAEDARDNLLWADHKPLEFLLLAMIVGHIAMVVVHRRSPGHTDVLPRMLGNGSR